MSNSLPIPTGLTATQMVNVLQMTCDYRSDVDAVEFAVSVDAVEVAVGIEGEPIWYSGLYPINHDELASPTHERPIMFVAQGFSGSHIYVTARFGDGRRVGDWAESITVLMITPLPQSPWKKTHGVEDAFAE